MNEQGGHRAPSAPSGGGVDSARDRLPELQQAAQYVRGIGPSRARLLEKLGIHKVYDLLFHFPRDYEDYSSLQSIADLVEGSSAGVVGTVVDSQEWVSARNTFVCAVLIEQGSDPQDRSHLRGIWFNQRYLSGRFQDGQRILLQGTPALEEGRWQMSHPRVTWMEEGAELTRGDILPVYPTTAGLPQTRIREMIDGVVAEYAGIVTDVLPESWRREKDLVDISTAIRQIHFPDSMESLELARRRFVYQELLVLQLALAMRRARLRRDSSAPPLPMDARIRARILRRFPFELSESQHQVIEEIARDMALPVPMNRLLHGEVGSGKTVTATFAMLLAVAHGYQAVLMAPTELLARQHLRTIESWLAGGRVHVGLWTGGQSEAERKQLAQEVAEGRIQIVVGTHALVSSPPPFQKLGIAIVDEQHKFGVRQRAALRSAGVNPHYLVMTATPIPRTVSMTAFGDLDVSELRKPAQRNHPVHTYLGNDESRDKWWEFVRQRLDEGRQAFVVAPLVRGEADSDVASAESMLESLANGPLHAYRLDLLHGRQTPAEKEAVMLGFVRGATQVLIATSIVEVGVNVPNATVMTIESAERFGLSQLHQIRGRVSRGNHPGYVCAFPSSGTDSDRERLQAFVDSSDGFELAEKDFQLRGPGNLFGDRQHGMPPLRIADLLRDGGLLQEARDDARRLIESDPDLTAAEFSDLRRMIVARYGSALEISDVG